MNTRQATAESSPLGKSIDYPDRYDPGLLYPIERVIGRDALGLCAPLPFTGVDLWTAYELSWLDVHGVPQVAIAQITVPADSPRLIESKSLKLYLYGFASTRQPDRAALTDAIARDLCFAAAADVGVKLFSVVGSDAMPIRELDGDCIDAIAIDVSDSGTPDAALLNTHDDTTAVEETLVSHLLKSNCPVTGQPDWASVQIRYRGPRMDRARLLRYLISYRGHSGFHEQCVERIFRDVLHRCTPQALSVYARYTRRGGIDINPYRATPGMVSPAHTRSARQ
ncbi:MAG: NADPH-dependent 7-cyano-7-deazaguanine reductase QueF [Dokdonella sp.]